MRREQFTPRVRRASSVPEPGEIIVPILILRSRVLHPGNERPRVKTLSFISLHSMSCPCAYARLHSFVRWGAIRGKSDATCDEGVCSKREDMFDAMRAAGVGPGAPTTSYGGGASTGGGSCPVDVDRLGRAAWALGACAREDDETTGLTVFLCCIRFLAVTHDGGALPGTRLASVGRRRRRASRGALRLTPTFLSFPPRAQDVPTATQRVQARRFFDALGDYTRARRVERISASARASGRVDSRASLSRWVCERHNGSTPSSENLS